MFHRPHIFIINKKKKNGKNKKNNNKNLLWYRKKNQPHYNYSNVTFHNFYLNSIIITIHKTISLLNNKCWTFFSTPEFIWILKNSIYIFICFVLINEIIKKIWKIKAKWNYFSFIFLLKEKNVYVLNKFIHSPADCHSVSHSFVLQWLARWDFRFRCNFLWSRTRSHGRYVSH